MMEKLKWIGLFGFLSLSACTPVELEEIDESNTSYDSQFVEEFDEYDQTEQKKSNEVELIPPETEDLDDKKIWREEDFKESIIYFVEGNEKISLISKNEENFMQPEATSEYGYKVNLEELKGFIIKPILQLENLVYVFDYLFLNENEILFFVATETEEYLHYKMSAYKYFIDRNEAEFLFLVNDHFGGAAFPYIESFSEDKKYIVLLSYGCFDCHPGYPNYLLMNLETMSFKGPFEFSHFEWLEKGEYRYKILEKIECEDGYPICYTDPEELPLIYDHF